MNTLLSDLRFGLRMLLKNPAVTFIAVLALTLGIGANTAIFTVVNAVILGTLPYANPEQLVTVWEKREGREQNVINLGNFTDWKKQNTVFSDMAVFLDFRANLTGDGVPEEIPTQIVTTNLLPLLGVTPIRGRLFAPDEGGEGQQPIAVISYGLWQRRFGGDEGVLGRKVMLNNLPTTISGFFLKTSRGMLLGIRAPENRPSCGHPGSLVHSCFSVEVASLVPWPDSNLASQ